MMFNEINKKLIGIIVIIGIVGASVLVFGIIFLLPRTISLDATFVSLDLINTTSDDLIFNVTFSIDNPSPSSIDVSQFILDNISYKERQIGFLEGGPLVLESGSSNITLPATLSARFNRTHLSDFLSDYLEGQSLPLRAKGNATLDISPLFSKTVVNLDFSTTIDGHQKSLIEDVEIKNIAIDLEPIRDGLPPTYSATANVTFTNPLPFSINASYFNSSVFFNDTDGLNIELFNWVVSFPPKNNILLTNISLDLRDAPLAIPAKKNRSTTISFSSSDLELAVRLFDEYYINDQLYVDIRNGVLDLQIGAFAITVNFSFSHIRIAK